jgi:hypothetical protein
LNLSKPIEELMGQQEIYIVFVIIMQNKDDGDWWLHFGYNNDNLRPVGLWAKSLFSGLSDHANLIVWGWLHTISHWKI